MTTSDGNMCVWTYSLTSMMQSSLLFFCSHTVRQCPCILGPSTYRRHRALSLVFNVVLLTQSGSIPCEEIRPSTNFWSVRRIECISGAAWTSPCPGLPGDYFGSTRLEKILLLATATHETLGAAGEARKAETRRDAFHERR